MRLALVCALGALHTCLAFRPKARPAWEGVAIVKPVTSATVVAHILSFVKALLEAFDASDEEYQVFRSRLASQPAEKWTKMVYGEPVHVFWPRVRNEKDADFANFNTS